MNDELKQALPGFASAPTYVAHMNVCLSTAIIVRAMRCNTAAKIIQDR